jgi:hypothetical protein
LSSTRFGSIGMRLMLHLRTMKNCRRELVNAG